LSISPIRRVMVSPGLSAAGIRFSIPPIPAEGLGLPYGRLTVLQGRTSSGFSTFRMREIRFGVGASYAPGPLLVFVARILRFLGPDWARYHRINQGSMTWGNGTYGDSLSLTRPTFA
jgi:hypothetical protein